MNYEQVIGKAIVFIENHLYDPIIAADVANAVSYSYYHFHRYFGLVMGETIGSYIRNRRLTQAAWELNHTSKRILDIGISFYFESAESFTRAFKNRYHMTPTEYRKNGVDTLIGAQHPVQINDISMLQYSNLHPEIVIVPPMHIIGMRFKTSIAENSSAIMWEQFNRQIIALKEPRLFQCHRYGIYEANITCSVDSFSVNSEMTAFIGIEPPARCSIPYEMQWKDFPGGKYARFIHVGSVDTLMRTYQYIWGIWFPKSGYELAERDDFECYTERFLGPNTENSEIEIYFPIK